MQAASRPSGEAKHLEAVALLTLNLESERRAADRDQNTVFKIRKDSALAGTLQESIEACVTEGQRSRDAARDQGVHETRRHCA